MRRWLLVPLVAALAGCASAPDPGYPEDVGPYVYDGGAYYSDPRPIDYDVEQRGYYRRTYDPYPYPYTSGGFAYRRYHRYHADHDRHDSDDRGRDRQHGGDRSATPPPRASAEPSRQRERVSRPPAAVERATPPSRRTNLPPRGSPRGNPGKSR